MSWQVEGYRAVRQLGDGASGRVVLAEQKTIGTPVAIKYLSDELRHDTQYLAAFRAEARLLSALDSPHVVRLWEYVEGPGGAAIVMELVDGVSLRAVLNEHGPTTPEAALCVLKGSLAGLGAAHRVGVVHRDYKPENVLVDTAGVSKLADFGIAVRSGRGAEVAGTPSYMAPEQWQGAPASPTTDIYAATATFFECLTGRPPFAADDLSMLRRQHEHVLVRVDDIPSALRDLVKSGLAKDPTRRHRDADELLSSLETIARSAYGDDWEERGRRELARRVALLAALLPLAGAVGGGLALARTVLGGLLVLGLLGGFGVTMIPTSDTTAAGPPTTVTRPAITAPGTTAPPDTPTIAPSSAQPTAGPTTTAPPPPPPPPPAALKVQQLSITSFQYQGLSTTVAVAVHVVTTTTGSFTLKIRYAGSNVDNSPGGLYVVERSFNLSGATSYDIPDTLDAFSYGCAAAWVGVGVSTTPAAQGGGPTYADLISPPC